MMKSLNFLLISLCMLSAFVCNSQTTYPSGVTGCIARWTFDTTKATTLTSLPDMSGNGHSGTTYDITSASGWRNIPFHAGSFNGTTSWSEVAHDAMLNPSNITIISLVKFDGYNNALCESSQILSKGFPYFISGNYGQSINDNIFDLNCGVFSPTKTQLVSQMGVSTISIPAGNYVELNKWYFLASTIGNTAMNQYQIEMDTNLKASSLAPINTSPGTSNIGSNTQNISIGKHLNSSYPYWLNGSIDELILFNRALSDNEIYSVYSYLWGWATGLDNIETSNSEFYSYFANGQLKITSNEQNYSFEVLNVTGQKIASKLNCNGNEEIKLLVNSTQVFFLRITNSRGKVLINKIASL